MSLNCLNLYNLKLFQSALVWRLYFIMNKEVKYYIDNMNNTISSQTPTLENLNNCDELRDFMMSHFDDPLNGTACFQGDMVEFNGYAVPKEGEVIPIDSVNFTVGTVNEVTNTFVLTLGKFTDEAYGVELPAYVREELIATLKGEW